MNKPTITRRQADAIEWALERDLSNEGIIRRVHDSAYIGPKSTALRAIPFDTLLAALVNGYEVEDGGGETAGSSFAEI
jgi:hypothetical protein